MYVILELAMFYGLAKVKTLWNVNKYRERMWMPQNFPFFLGKERK